MHKITVIESGAGVSELTERKLATEVLRNGQVHLAQINCQCKCAFNVKTRSVWDLETIAHHNSNRTAQKSLTYGGRSMLHCIPALTGGICGAINHIN